jgi:hypothetical protein
MRRKRGRGSIGRWYFKKGEKVSGWKTNGFHGMRLSFINYSMQLSKEKGLGI